MCLIGKPTRIQGSSFHLIIPGWLTRLTFSVVLCTHLRCLCVPASTARDYKLSLFQAPWLSPESCRPWAWHSSASAWGWKTRAVCSGRARSLQIYQSAVREMVWEELGSHHQADACYKGNDYVQEDEIYIKRQRENPFHFMCEGFGLQLEVSDKEDSRAGNEQQPSCLVSSALCPLGTLGSFLVWEGW